MDSYSIQRRGRLVFLHIPKTAGTSMRAYLRNQYHPSDICPASNWGEAAQLTEPRDAWRLYQGHYRYNFAATLPRDTRRMVILRHPISRTLSALRHLRRDPQFHPDHRFVANQPLPRIIRNGYVMRRQRDVQTFWLSAAADPQSVEAHLRTHPKSDPFSIEADVSDEAALERAKRNLEDIDFIGFTEDIAPLLADLSWRMGFHPATSLPLLNDNREPESEDDAIGEPEYQALADVNQLDLALYDHAIDVVARRHRRQVLSHFQRTGLYRPPAGPFVIDLDEVVPGTGWHEAEHNAGHTYRWTGPERYFTLDVVLRPDVSYQLDFSFRTFDRAPVREFHVEMNGTELAAEITMEDRHHNACVRISPQLLRQAGGLCSLVFDAGQPVRPQDTGGADERLLGVVVSRIAFTPLAAEDGAAVQSDRIDELFRLLHQPIRWSVERYDGVTAECETMAIALWLAQQWSDASLGLERITAPEPGIELRPQEILGLWQRLWVPT